jgi:hypothetical protein
MIGRLPGAALRFARTHPGTYIAVTGEATRRVCYAICRRSRQSWRAERTVEMPGGGWVVSGARTVETLKAAEQWCEDCARKDRACHPKPGDPG